MAPIKTKEIKRSLLAKGFRLEETHHEVYWLYIAERRMQIRTRISHGEREYDDRLQGEMARQMRINRRQFNEFVECTLTGERYVALLQQQGAI